MTTQDLSGPNPLMPALDGIESYDVLIAHALRIAAKAAEAARADDSIDALLYAQAANELTRAAERLAKMAHG